MMRIKSVLRNLTPHIIVLLICLLISNFLFSGWFTQNPNQVDSWFYWGAGDFPELSYLNNFGDTYYLERYVVIGPQIIFNMIFGSYFGSLAVAIFWLSISYLLLWNFSRLMGVRHLFFSFIPFFLVSRGNLINFGSNLHHPSTITLLFLLAYVICSKRRIVLKIFTLPNAFLVGVIWGLIANAYLSIAFYVSIPILLYLFNFGRDGEHSDNSSESIKTRTRMNLMLRNSIYVFLGFFSISCIFEGIHRIVATPNYPILWEQMVFGKSLLQNKNPWNGGGFFDFWTNGVFVTNSLPWITLICSITGILLVYRHPTFIYFQLRNFFLGIIIAMSLMTIGYSAPTFHTFTACALVPCFYLSLIVLLKHFSSSFDFYLVRNVLLFMCAFFVFFQTLWVDSGKFDEVLFRAFCFTFIGINLLVIFTALMPSLRLKIGIRTSKWTSFLLLIVVSSSLIPQSLLQLYTAENIGFESYKVGRDFYEDLSKKRKVVYSEAVRGEPTARIWVTPDDNNALAASLLYGYSLISFVPNSHSCGQVEWALQQQNSLLISFNPKNFSEESLNRYLDPCKATIDNFRFSNGLSNSSRDPYVAGRIIKQQS